MSNCLNVFDRIYLINLEKRKDRLDKWLKENSFVITNLSNFEIVKAVDGKELVKHDEWGESIGALGCLETHLNILKDAREKGYKQILIFEDDFKFDEDFFTLFQKGWDTLPSNWDMLYLYAGDFKPAVPYNEKLLKLTATLSTVSYAITAPSIPLFIDLLERRNYPVDVVYGHLHFLLNAFRFKKNICHHYDGYSDVQDATTNYHYKKTLTEKILSKIQHYKIKLS